MPGLHGRQVHIVLDGLKFLHGQLTAIKAAIAVITWALTGLDDEECMTFSDASATDLFINAEYCQRFECFLDEALTTIDSLCDYIRSEREANQANQNNKGGGKWGKSAAAKGKASVGTGCCWAPY